MNCSKRFICKAENQVSIDVDQVCDGKQDCDDNRDEKDCKDNKNNVFSSEQEMIANPALKSCFWIMGIAVISGNLYVIISTILLKRAKLNKSLRYQNIIILNISIADMVMGIYLLSIAVYSAYYSGYYGQINIEWQSSLRCSLIGSLAVLSSEASCLFMVLLTSIRLYAIYKPFSILSTTTGKYKLAIILVWFMAFLIAVLPIPHQKISYFVQSKVEFSNRFTRSKIWNKEKIIKFACRLAILKNKSMECNCNDWDSTKSFLKHNDPEYYPGADFGYYGQTSVCMPRFYVNRGESAWEYSLVIITVNFLSFFFIAVSYICMFVKAKKNNFLLKNNEREKQESRMQRRISRIIITDFLCWIPICIMAFAKLSGLYVDDVAYIVSAGLLLPINSAFNPLLYSPLLDKLKSFFKKLRNNRLNQQEVFELNNIN